MVFCSTRAKRERAEIEEINSFLELLLARVPSMRRLTFGKKGFLKPSISDKVDNDAKSLLIVLRKYDLLNLSTTRSQNSRENGSSVTRETFNAFSIFLHDAI